MDETNAPETSLLSTGDLARRTGTTLRTVRFYEEIGVLKPSQVGAGGRRLYTEADLQKLELITDLRELDLSIDEIRDLLQIRAGCRDAPQLAEKFGQALAEQLDRTQRRLNALRRLRAEFAAALELLGECKDCSRPLEAKACLSCDVISRDEAPRIMKVVVGSAPCGEHRRADEEPTGA